MKSTQTSANACLDERARNPALSEDHLPAAFKPACSVLIVDPNEVSREILATTLETAGYGAITTGTADDAEDLLRHSRPDLVLQSLVLTDANWWDIAFRMPRSRAVPIVGYACVLPVEAKGNDKHGFAGFLTKPFAPAYLVRSLPFYLWNKPIPQPLAAANHSENYDTLTLRSTLPDAPPQEVRVLIVEDNEFQRERLVRAFSQENYSVSVARHGIEALERLGREQPDVLVSDTLMTGCDGFELCLAVRKLEAMKTLPVVLTPPNHIDPLDERVARAVGADAYVGRTNGFDRLVDTVRVLANLSARSVPQRLDGPGGRRA